MKTREFEGKGKIGKREGNGIRIRENGRKEEEERGKG